MAYVDLNTKWPERVGYPRARAHGEVITLKKEVFENARACRVYRDIQICALFNIRDPIVSAITPTAFRFPVDLIEPRVSAALSIICDYRHLRV